MSHKIKMFETRSKQAIFINSKQFSDYEYDKVTYDIRNGEICGINKESEKEIIDAYYATGVGILVKKDLEANREVGLLSYYGGIIIDFGVYNNIKIDEYGKILVQEKPEDEFEPFL